MIKRVELVVPDGSLEGAVELVYRKAVRKQIEGLLELLGGIESGALMYSELLTLGEQFIQAEVARMERIGWNLPRAIVEVRDVR